VKDMNTPEPLYVPELEQQLLGALLSNNDLYHQISGDINADHFGDQVHAAIFKNIVTRIANEHLASPVTLKVDMENHEGLKELGGPAYLVRLVGASMGASQIKHYASEITQLWQRRTLDKAFMDASEAIRDGQGADEAKAALELLLTTMPASYGQENSMSWMKALTETVSDIQQAYEGHTSSITTGLDALDKKLGGLFRQNLVVIGGRPSMGKTSLALKIAIANAAQGKKVAIVSLEMSVEELGQRVLSEKSQIPYFNFRNNSLTDVQLSQTTQAAKGVMELPIAIIPKHVREVASIYAALKKQKARMGGLDLVIVDYLQLMRAKGSGRTEQMTEVSLQLKHFAGLLDVPVVALSQLNRSLENRDDKRPMLSDLRESGQIEQDADVVLFCYRDYYYLQREKKPEKVEELVDHEAALLASKGVMEVNVAKQRMGPIGTVKVGCDMATNRFWDLDTPQQQTDMEGF